MEPKHITDEQLLEWLETGLLEIRFPRSFEPQLWFRGRRLKPEITVQRGRQRVAESGERYSWVLRFNGRKRRVVRSKLIWMNRHRRVVPAGCQLHHENENRFDDREDNVLCLTAEQHETVHYDMEF